ncbi:hypothetical protein L6164_006594 [Bauhinia variegata]|uniref:Uncharacterized protein n=1 Tax=Bauhinia variegata TaxID=167791 RepID=A0ACB9PUX5_BAUVA|nr:hypothetical protein L6164_006594 [Bauhinia variegata]
MQNFLLSMLIASKLCRKSTQLGFLPQNPFLAFNSFTCKTYSQLREDSFTVSYLIDSCGLSPKAAIHASKSVRLENPDKPNSVLSLLRNYGFSEIQLSKIVKRRATLLVANPEKILLPKMKFFLSIGISNTDLPKILVSNPQFLTRSLNKCIIPRYRVLKSILFNDEEVAQTIKLGNWCFTNLRMDNIVSNVKLLREVGVPQRSISLLVTGYPDVAFFKHAKFGEAVKTVLGMGFDPLKSSFITAINVLGKLKQPVWESRLKTFERWGWSREVALSTFKKFPFCMLTSEEKIGKVMHFLVKEMGYTSEDIAHIPNVLTLSLEKRIIPRCSVVQTLKSKHLVKNDMRLGGFILLSEKQFSECFVSRLETTLMVR